MKWCNFPIDIGHDIGGAYDWNISTLRHSLMVLHAQFRWAELPAAAAFSMA
jgi:hypothetical protein